MRARYHMSRSSNGSGQNATNVQIRVRVPSGIPNHTEWKWRGVAKPGLKRSALTREIESSNLSSPARFLCENEDATLGGRSAARTRVFEACYGSSSLPLPTIFSRGRRTTDQDTRLRTGRLEVRILPPVPFSARRPMDRAQPSEG